MDQPKTDAEMQEHAFERKYKSLLHDIEAGKTPFDNALEIILADYKALKANPHASDACVFPGREKEIWDAYSLAGQRAAYGMGSSARKSLAEIAEENRKISRYNKICWATSIGTFVMGLTLPMLLGDSAPRNTQYRAPGEIRHDPLRPPQYLRDEEQKKEPEKTENNSVPRWE
jgi:hypothetical protein